jgi:hypothetical protein
MLRPTALAFLAARSESESWEMIIASHSIAEVENCRKRRLRSPRHRDVRRKLRAKLFQPVFWRCFEFGSEFKF